MFSIKKNLLSISLLIVYTSFGMTQSNKKENVNALMQRIVSWEKVKPFADHVVAYKATSYYLGTKKGYPIHPDSSIKYGKIESTPSEWSSGKTGYNMSRLLKEKDVAGNCALTDQQIERGNLYMRLLTLEEIKRIRDAVHSGKAEFESCFDKRKVDSFLLKLKNLTGTERRRYLHNTLDSLHWIRLGNIDYNSRLSWLPLDLINYISQLVIDYELSDKVIDAGLEEF